MMRFQDRVYAHSQKGLLVWEPSWETFRPVEAIVWNPIHKQIEPYYGIYTADIFDSFYGFLDDATHQYCIEFTDDHAHHIGGVEPTEDIQTFWTWTKLPLKWVGDRPMQVHPCAGDPERKLFLSRYSLRAKTCRKAPRNLRGTRKLHKH